jgi:hypothetical protein
MSQDTVEKFLGRILTDGFFRTRFFADRDRRLAELDLLDHERESLRRLTPDTIEQLVVHLDPRIVRG